MQQIIVGSYLDISDYTTPIKQFLTDSWTSFRPDNCVLTSIFLKKCIINLSDSLIGLFDSGITDYFYVQSTVHSFLTDQDYGPGEGVYFYQQYQLDMSYDIYERSVYTITGVLKDVGGFYNALYFIGLFIYSQFSGSIFFSAFINRLY